jgi:hypothetical protein
MAAAAISSFPLPHPTILCPPPLQFQKRPRKATIGRRMLRRATQTQKQAAHGPLDDIIAEIKSDIRESLPEYIGNPSFFDWGNPLKAPSTWAVTPLPVSRAPSDQPLTIRKNRNSRSSESGSSMGDSTSYSRNNSQDETMSGSAVGTSLSFGTTSWPLFHNGMLRIPANVSSTSPVAIYTEHTTARQSLENAVERASSHIGTVPQRRPSRLRMLTNGFPHLRRMGTGDTSASGGDASEPTSPTIATTPSVSPDDSDEAVDAYMKRNAHKSVKLQQFGVLTDTF